MDLQLLSSHSPEATRASGRGHARVSAPLFPGSWIYHPPCLPGPSATHPAVPQPLPTQPLNSHSREVASAGAELAQASSYRNNFPAALGLNCLQPCSTVHRTPEPPKENTARFNIIIIKRKISPHRSSGFDTQSARCTSLRPIYHLLESRAYNKLKHVLSWVGKLP